MSILQTNEIEIHFAVGEALADCALGVTSPSGRNMWTEQDPLKEQKAVESEEENMEEVSRYSRPRCLQRKGPLSMVNKQEYFFLLISAFDLSAYFFHCIFIFYNFQLFMT